MEISISKYKNKLTVAPKGRLDAMTAPELEEKLKNCIIVRIIH